MKKVLSFVLSLALVLSVLPFGVVGVLAETVSNTVEISGTDVLKSYDFNNSSGIAYKRYIKQMEYLDGALKLSNQAGSGSVWFAKDASFTDATNHPNSGAALIPEAYDTLLRLDAESTVTVSFKYKFLTGSNRLEAELMFAPDVTATIDASAPTNWDGVKFSDKTFETVTLPEGETELSADTDWYNASYTFTVKTKSINLGIRPVAYNKGEVCNVLVDDVVIELWSPVELTYSVVDGNAVVTDCDGEASGNLTIPETLDGYTVTEISNDAFAGCTKLNKITLPDSVVRIADRAFCDTAFYKNEANWENGVLYSGNHLVKALTTVDGAVSLKEGTITVADSAFADCKSVTAVGVPSSLKNVGRNAFLNCVNISSVTASSLSSWCAIEFGANANPLMYAAEFTVGASAVSGDVAIPDSVTKIGNGAFNGFIGITSVTVPSSVTEIGDFAFSDCANLGAVSLGNGVETIGKAAFNNTALSEIIIPDSVKSIDAYAFHNCLSLTAVTVGSGLESVGAFAFYGCESVATVNITDLENWAKISFENYDSNPLWYAEGLYLDGQKLTGDIVLSEGLTEIGNGAFYGMSGITSVTIPSSVTEIGEFAFAGCTALTTVKGAENVTSIGRHAFFGCSALTSVAVPESVTAIGDGAFENCTSLKNFNIPAKLEDLGTGVFAGCVALETLTVSSGNAKYHGSSNCVIETATKALVAGCKNSVIPTDGSVTAIGHSAFLGQTGLKSVTIPSTVTSIGEAAFADCTNLTSITVPDSVVTIGDHAFNGCSALTTVNIGNGVTVIGDGAFKDCAKITTAKVGSNIEIIGENAFSGCSLLGSFSIPSKVRTIGNGAFNGCAALTSIAVPDSVVNFGCDVFNGCVKLATATIGNGVTSIGENTFNGCSVLKTATLGNSVKAIGDKAFYNCVVLTSVNIPEGVKTIGEMAFYNCKKLTSVDIPDGVTYAGVQSFKNCTALTTVTIGVGLTTISEKMFSGCSNLSAIDIPEGVVTIADTAFGDCKKMTKVTLPNTLKTIENGAFYNCKLIEELNLPDSLTVINQYAFFGCALIETVTIPEGVISIPTYTFGNCTSLTEVFIPYSVITIGKNAFDGCSGISVVYLGRTEAQWTDSGNNDSQKVSVSSGNDSLTNATMVFCADAPVVAGTPTKDTVVLTPVSGCEYSKDGINWQASSVFMGLSSNTQYNFYCRTAATATQKAGYMSRVTMVTTAAELDLDGDEVLTQSDAIYLLYHVLFGDLYQVTVDADLNADGKVTADDAIYALYHTLYGGEQYPLYPDNSFDVSGGDNNDKDQGFNEWVPIG